MTWREITDSKDVAYPQALALLCRSIATGAGEMRPDDVAWLVDNQKSRLFAVEGDGVITAAVLVQIQRLPARTLLFVHHLAGISMDPLVENWWRLQALARENGATSIAGACSEAMARIYKAKLGGVVRKVYIEQEIPDEI